MPFTFSITDAISADKKIVIEVEAGRATENHQFLKDIFEASMMFGVEYLVIAMRKIYRNHNDSERIYPFLETMYITNRIKLPLKGILLKETNHYQLQGEGKIYLQHY